MQRNMEWILFKTEINDFVYVADYWLIRCFVVIPCYVNATRLLYNVPVTIIHIRYCQGHLVCLCMSFMRLIFLLGKPNGACMSDIIRYTVLVIFVTYGCLPILNRF